MSNQENVRDKIPGKEKKFSIVINGVENIVDEKRISFEKVVQLAEIPSAGPNSMLTVAYERGEHDKSSMLTSGDEVKVKEGMFFHVEYTNRS